MGRLGSFFSNVGSGIKNFGLRVGSTFNKIAPKALHYGRLITGGLSKLPGVIGTAAGIVHRGMSYADNIINSLPDSNLKDKLTNCFLSVSSIRLKSFAVKSLSCTLRLSCL